MSQEPPEQHSAEQHSPEQQSSEQHSSGEPSVPDSAPAPGTDPDAPRWPKMEDGSPTLATDTNPDDPGATTPTS